MALGLDVRRACALSAKTSLVERCPNPLCNFIEHVGWQAVGGIVPCEKLPFDPLVPGHATLHANGLNAALLGELAKDSIVNYLLLV